MTLGTPAASIPPTIIVLNARFVPSTRSAPYLYGVVQHAIRTADVLAKLEVPVGFLLYERQPGTELPELREHAVLDYPAIVVRFDFGIAHPAMATAFRAAVEMLEKRRRSSVRDRRGSQLYFQTSAVLPFAPRACAIAVTHHAPFVDQVTAAIGPHAARAAFDWDHPKADHLARTQAAGIEFVASHSDVRCLEISPIQERYLAAHRIDDRRIRALAQPLEDDATTDGRHSDVARAAEILPENGFVALTAVSRFDGFKRVELFVEGAAQAVAARAVEHVVVIGGEPVDERRESLMSMIPISIRPAFTFLPRVPHSLLVRGLFPSLAGRGVFVCSSRFDLVPYTVLEAARVGLCTIVPDIDTVGSSAYLPPNYRYAPTSSDLTALLSRLARDGRTLRAFASVGESIARGTSDEAFLETFAGSV